MLSDYLIANFFGDVFLKFKTLITPIHVMYCTRASNFHDFNRHYF